MNLSIGDVISDASSCTGLIDLEVLEVVPLAVTPSLANFIEISDNFNSIRGSDDGGGTSRVPQDDDHLEEPMKEDGEGEG